MRSATRRNTGSGGGGKAQQVCDGHQYNRLSTIAQYLEWLAHEVLGEHRDRDDDNAIQRLVRAIKARRAPVDNDEPDEDRALTEEQRNRLLEITDPDHPDNPFRDRKGRERNALIVMMLLQLGLRRGELLGVQVPDINWAEQTLTVHRRADEADDPRIRQPRTKTLARKLALFPDLLAAIDRYVRGPRRKTRRADTHRYLLVTHHKGEHEGAPLSEQGFAKVFDVIQEADPLLATVHPHALRHDWNWRFSQAMDRKPEEKMNWTGTTRPLDNAPTESGVERRTLWAPMRVRGEREHRKLDGTARQVAWLRNCIAE